jgi:hypothetical protein
MSYINWNELIANYFFNEEMAGKEVLLFVDEALINEIGGKIDKDSKHFISSIIAGPPWVDAHSNYGICQKAFLTYNNWRYKGLRYPPYIGYLALFVLAGYVEDGNFSQVAYYPKLRALLGEEEGSGQYPSFHKMKELWMDLEKWSKEDKFEELGRFTVRKRGNLRHVGLPQSQTIISRKERRSIPLIFNRAGIISSDLPDSDTIRTMLSEHGQDILTRKTLRLLRLEEENEHLLQSLLDLVTDELNEWDGSLPEEFVGPDSTVWSRIKICLNLDRVTEMAKFSLRINAQNEFPNEPLHFHKKSSPIFFYCRGSIDNWSTELKHENGLLLNGSILDWLQGEQFEDKENRWKCTLKGSKVRVFVEGRKFGLPNNLVETPRIERGVRFIILCYESIIEEILEWGKNACDTFRRIDYKGIPNGWALFSGINPRESYLGIPELTIDSEIKVRLVDGIRLGKGNTFLNASLPKILLENCIGTEVVLLNEEPLQLIEENQFWELPEDLPLDQTLTIKVLNQGTEIKRSNFKVTNSRLSIPDKKSYLEATGVIESPDTPILIGINVYNTNVPPFEYKYTLPTSLSNEIIFIGQHLGEVFHWQGKTEIKLEWEPIWAICKVKKRKWKAHYCSMKKVIESQINSEVIVKKDLKTWKNVLYKTKKSIEKPDFPPLYDLWERYLEVAKSVR